MRTWWAIRESWQRRSGRGSGGRRLGQIYQTLKSRGGAWIITADHGNAETMIDPATGGPHTYHTTNPVPFILVSDDEKMRLRPGGSLRDIAPTMLSVLGQPKPVDMTGTDLRMTS